MVFPSVSIGSRVELAEGDLLADIVRGASVRASSGDAQGPFQTAIGSGVAGYLEPHAPMNKIIGLGCGGDGQDIEADTASLAAIEAAYAARSCPVQVELSTLADPAYGAMLTQRGYVLRGFEDVLGIEPASADHAATPAATGLEIAESGREELDEWVALTVEGFAHPDGQGIPSPDAFPRAMLTRVMTDLVRAPGFVRYLVRRDGVAAGAGCWRVGPGGISQLCGASTLPDHRRRGVQSMLLRRRLADAVARGVELVVMTTQPGSRSQQNALRFGFARLHSRAVLVRDPASA